MAHVLKTPAVDIKAGETAMPAGETTHVSFATQATRYLAAAAYTDKVFRDRVIEMREAEYQAVAPEPGVDADFIVKHCRIARRRKILRDAMLCVIPLALLSSGVFGEVIDSGSDLREVLAAHSWLFIGCWALATAIIFGEALLNGAQTLSDRIGREVQASSKGAATSAEAGGNVVVYGGFSPFVGAGFDLNGFSFTVNLEQAKKSLDGSSRIRPFSAESLYDELKNGFERLGIKGLRVSDRLYIEGRSIRDDRRFLPRVLGRPVNRVDESIVGKFRSDPGKAIRHYLCVEIVDWGGELILSTFIRLHLSASKLFIEVSNFMLPPLKAAYYELDKRVRVRFAHDARVWLARAIALAPFYVIVAVFVTLRLVARPWNRFLERRRMRKEVRLDPTHNYGAQASIRELGTVNMWRTYFQRLDKEMHGKIVQQQLLDVLIEFLDAHGVDTSEIKDRGTHIQNNGVIVSGGSVTAETMAVGKGAKAEKKQTGKETGKA